VKKKLLIATLVLVLVVVVPGCASAPTGRDELPANDATPNDNILDFTAEIHDVLNALQNPGDWAILDVRTRQEFEGTPGSSQGVYGHGRIAGAVNIEWDRAVDGAGNLLPENELREIFSEVLDGRSVIVYCRSGARSSHTWGVLNSLGVDVLNFDGSWIEWSSAASADGNFPDREVVLSFTEAWTEAG